ncbi:Probable WRKY transcription factor 19 [Linum perenne]
MALHSNSVRVSYDNERVKNDNLGDTTLRLNFLGYEGNGTTRFSGNQSNLNIDFGNGPDDGCKLVLGLGPTPSTYNSDFYNNVGAVSIKPKGSLASAVSCREGLFCGGDSILKLGLSGVANDSLSGLDSSVTETNLKVPAEDNRLLIPVVDEGSTTAKKSGGYMPSLLLAPRMDIPKVPPQAEVNDFGSKSQCYELEPSYEPSAATTDFSMSSASEQATTTVTSGSQHSNNPKKCKFVGCSKGGRGASGLCIGHGGGQRCQKHGCNKGAESRTAYCKAHGGGRRCDHLGCTKSAEGKTDFCIAHGGGRRCGYLGGCTKAARGKSGLCIRHGGGKRCKVNECTRSAEGQAGLCISHGGGRRCQHDNCSKGAQGSTKFCKAHGGGKRCVFAGCTKGAEGSTPLCKAHGGGKRCLYDGGGICPKSVHGGTNFCVAHGGGKRCVVPGCTKSARGRTDCCVRHGGGKRCKYGNCGKSAQGSTDLCKAHGGGKRCSWGGEGGKCDKFARGKSGLCAAHTSSSNSSMAHERRGGGLIRSGLFHGLVVSSASSIDNNNNNNNTYSLSGGTSAVSNSSSFEKPAKRQHLIPPQVLVPLSMKSSMSYSSLSSGAGKVVGGSSDGVRKSMDEMVIPEGRVHGGGLMSLFGGNLKKVV